MEKKKNGILAVLVTFLLCFGFWLLLTWTFDAQEVIAGLLVSLVAALFSARYFVHEDALRLFKPQRFGALFAYVFVFLQELWKANVDVAKRCLTGCKNINPGIIRIPVETKGDYAQAMLANSITLTPGTMTLDIAEDPENGNVYYYIHWLDVASEDPEEAGQMIKGRMEKWIRRIWE